MEVVAPLGIKVVPTLLRAAQNARVVEITFCNQVELPPQSLRQIGDCGLQLCQKVAGAEIENSMNRIQAQRVEVIVLQPVQCVFDKESPYFIAAHTVKVESLAPGRSITICKV